MILENTRLLFKLYYRPLAAMSGIIDEGSWLYAVLAVALISALVQFAVGARIYASYEAAPVPAKQRQQPTTERELADNDRYAGNEYESYKVVRPATRRLPLPLVGRFGWWFFSFSPSTIFTTVFALALLYVPITTLIMIIFEPLGSFGVVLRRDYGSLLACTLMAWAAAHLPLALTGLALGMLTGGNTSVLWLLCILLLSKIYFAILMICALRTVFGASFGNAIGTICFSWISVFFESYLLALASPFILFLAYSYFRGDVSDIGSLYRSRQNFRRNLEAATINPHDAEANYQLGLIYQQRRQYTEAIARFKRAIEIDPREIDAHFQLGRIAREQGRLQDAIDHFNAVVTQDDKHAQSEIWREIGATYVAASMFEDARAALERYLERRPYDAEGLYHLGATFNKLGQLGPARELFERCIEAVKTMPYYRRSQMRRWRKLSEEQLRALRVSAEASGV